MRIIGRRSAKRCLLLAIVIFMVLSALVYSPILLIGQGMEERDDISLKTRKIPDNSSSVKDSAPHHLQPPQPPPVEHNSPSPLPNHKDEYHQLATQPPHHARKSSQQIIPQPHFSHRPQDLSVSTTHPSPPKPHKPAIPKPECIKPHCAEFLSRADLSRQKGCYNEVLKANRGTPKDKLAALISDNDCYFMNGAKRDPVALASAEGSGNTWVRGLLERATGFCTGFNFCDYVMRMKGFIGDNINSGSVLVVKTHMDKPQWVGEELRKPINKYEAKYGSAVFLMRNPYDSLIAEWNRRLTNDVLIKNKLPHNESHTNVAPRDIWYSSDWDKFLHTYMTAWLLRVQMWVLNQQPSHPVMVVRYEDLKTDTMKEMERMLTFLGFPFSEEEVSERLAEDFTVFKRAHRGDDFKHYTDDQMMYMRSVLLEAIKSAEDKNMAHVLKLDDYLEKFE